MVLQEASGFFFCLEDRALLCRSCDLAIHTANPYVSAHQRFLVTGVRVGLDPTEPVAPAASQQSHSAGRVVVSLSEHLPTGTHLVSSTETNAVSSSQIANQNGGLLVSKAPLYGFSMSETILDWPLDDFFGFPDFNQNFGFTEHSASKVGCPSLALYLLMTSSWYGKFVDCFHVIVVFLDVNTV